MCRIKVGISRIKYQFLGVFHDSTRSIHCSLLVDLTVEVFITVEKDQNTVTSACVAVGELQTSSFQGNPFSLQDHLCQCQTLPNLMEEHV